MIEFFQGLDTLTLVLLGLLVLICGLFATLVVMDLVTSKGKLDETPSQVLQDIVEEREAADVQDDPPPTPIVFADPKVVTYEEFRQRRGKKYGFAQGKRSLWK